MRWRLSRQRWLTSFLRGNMTYTTLSGNFSEATWMERFSSDCRTQMRETGSTLRMCVQHTDPLNGVRLEHLLNADFGVGNISGQDPSGIRPLTSRRRTYHRHPIIPRELSDAIAQGLTERLRTKFDPTMNDIEDLIKGHGLLVDKVIQDDTFTRVFTSTFKTAVGTANWKAKDIPIHATAENPDGDSALTPSTDTAEAKKARGLTYDKLDIIKQYFRTLGVNENELIFTLLSEIEESALIKLDDYKSRTYLQDAGSSKPQKTLMMGRAQYEFLGQTFKIISTGRKVKLEGKETSGSLPESMVVENGQTYTCRYLYAWAPKATAFNVINPFRLMSKSDEYDDVKQLFYRERIACVPAFWNGQGILRCAVQR